MSFAGRVYYHIYFSRRRNAYVSNHGVFRAHKEKTESYGVRHYFDYRLGTIIVTAANTLGDSSRDGRANLIVFLVGFFGEEPGLLQLILEGVHALFVRQAAILENLAGALRWTHIERKSSRLKIEYINGCELKR